jgi:hypothetical protein
MKLWAMGGDGMVRTGVTIATRKKKNRVQFEMGRRD